MEDRWYYEYAVIIWNEIDKIEELRSGVVSAESLVEAMKELYEYYGDEIVDVQTLRAITDGAVFEFQYVTEDTDFSYTMEKK